MLLVGFIFCQLTNREAKNMLQVDYTTVREVQRNPKKISQKVNEADFSYVVMSNNKPQFVIVSLKNFSKLQKPKKQSEAAPLLDLLTWAEQADLDLPADLSQKHNRYLWEQEKHSQE